MQLNSQQIKEEITREIRKFQNLYDAVKTGLMGIFIATNAYK